ncbi:IclR family transcriptional regulator C-terminal domain-containing protein [Pararoseomonas sp. SCSIO 73927]|uniref:IclR family transcriptional regulator n=1 Tax=Pararoseomonas sp. SCSIO 73927 TaxID=3114537 RepID=UPI0030CDFD56
MSGFQRYADLLNLFDEGRSDWSIPAISEALGVPSSTIYRTVRELMAEGFLEPALEGHYRLGSAFIAFERLIRTTDPIVRIGGELLPDIVAQARVPAVAVLARLFGRQVMCVADAAPPGAAVRTSYERGRPRPMLRGATSKVILAQLPSRRLNRLLETEVDPHPLAPEPVALRAELTAIRRRGYCITRGEVDEGVVGIAAPVPVPERALVASLSLVVSEAALDDATERRLTLLVVSTANIMTEELRRLGQVPG